MWTFLALALSGMHLVVKWLASHWPVLFIIRPSFRQLKAPLAKRGKTTQVQNTRVPLYVKLNDRVRTILVLGYWVLGNIHIHRYWIVSLLEGIFCCSDTQYNTNQTAVSTIHIPVNEYVVPLFTCTLTDAIVCLDTMLIFCCLLNTIIVIIIEFWDFCGHCYAVH